MNTSTDFTPFSSAFVEFESCDSIVPAFGVLQLSVNAFPNTSRHLDIHFALDNSGSMNDRCADGRRKQSHINFTATKMVQYLQSHNITSTVAVDSFDGAVISVSSAQELTQENVCIISDKIDKISPNGETNIAAVLDKEIAWSQGVVLKDRVFVLFTDGQATKGKVIAPEGLVQLSRSIHPATTVVTIGCGEGHDYEALSGIANRKNGIYKFVSGIESAAFACGEVLDKIINKVIEDCSIVVINGEIWDWKTNKWSNRITTDNVVGECNKVYHVRSVTPALFKAEFVGTVVETCAPFMQIIDEVRENQDVRKYMWRQKTLELVHEAKTIPEINWSARGQEHPINLLKKKLKEHLIKMKAFMDENSLREDLFMCTLCDDIFTCHNAAGTQYGGMYIASRQRSQASQEIYSNVLSAIPDDPVYDVFDFNSPCAPPSCGRQLTCRIAAMGPTSGNDEDDVFDPMPASVRNCTMSSFLPPPPLERENVRMKTIDEELEDDTMKRHVTISNNASPYANDKTLKVMREVSCSSSAQIPKTP